MTNDTHSLKSISLRSRTLRSVQVWNMNPETLLILLDAKTFSKLRIRRRDPKSGWREATFAKCSVSLF